MKTVKEVSELTGISVRTLHYYDEIGLFKPTEVTEAGYRLYDDKAIERLGQILVFRELDLPLADIKLIMDNPDLDRNSVLAKQRKMLCLKKQRLERIIANLDNMLKGDHDMDFTVFDETELRAMFSIMRSSLYFLRQSISRCFAKTLLRSRSGLSMMSLISASGRSSSRNTSICPSFSIALSS